MMVFFEEEVSLEASKVQQKPGVLLAAAGVSALLEYGHLISRNPKGCCMFDGS